MEERRIFYRRSEDEEREALVSALDARAREDLALREQAALQRFEHVRLAPEEIFSRIASIAALICAAPKAVVTLMDDEDHRFIGNESVEFESMPRDVSLSELPVREDGLVVIEDTHADPRTCDLSTVTGEPFVRSYLGVPLCPDGVAVGTLSVADVVPRTFTEAQCAGLRALGEIVEQQFQNRLLLEDYTRCTRENTNVKRSLQLLHDLTAMISSSPDFDSTCSSVLEKICTETGWTLGQLWEKRDDGETLACSPNVHSESDENASFISASHEIYFAKGEGLPGMAWERGTPVWVRDLALAGSFPREEAANQAGIRTGMAFPVKADDEIVAVIEFFAPETREQDTHLVRLISTVTGELGAVFQRKRAEDRLAHHVGHDGLTGLPNRIIFMDRLSIALDEARRSGIPISIILVGLDTTTSSRVNEVHGHTAGDELRRRVTARLSAQLRKSDTIARIGGGIFAVLLRDATNALEIDTVAEKLRGSFMEPLQILDQTIYAHANLGISTFPQDGSTPEALLSAADNALYDAAQQGRNTVGRFTPSMLDAARDRLVTELGIRQGLERQEFVVHYQPQIDIMSGKIVAAEALLRWNHPERGMVPPMEFIPTAEASGLIHPLGDFVLERACEQAMGWEDRSLRVAVNLSPSQFLDPTLVTKVCDTLKRTGLPHENLELEITEGIAMQDIDRTIRVLQELASHGVSVAIDDFGVGYSSLYYLKRMPISRLKVDRSFIADLANSNEDRAILRAIIELVSDFNASHVEAGREQRIHVVAEGVETSGQLDILRLLKCHMAQGYLFSRPVSNEDLGALFATLRTQDGAAETPT